MVDVLTTRVQAMYTNWDQTPDSSSSKKISANTLRNYDPEVKRSKFKAFSSDDIFKVGEKNKKRGRGGVEFFFL